MLLQQQSRRRGGVILSLRHRRTQLGLQSAYVAQVGVAQLVAVQREHAQGEQSDDHHHETEDTVREGGTAEGQIIQHLLAFMLHKEQKQHI